MWGSRSLPSSNTSLEETFGTSSIGTHSSTESSFADHAQQDSHFLKLPSELRIMIYDLALQDVLVYKVAERRYEEDPTIALALRHRSLPFLGALALLHTCRELRNEGLNAFKPLARAKLEERTRISATTTTTAQGKMSTGTVTSQFITEAVPAYDAFFQASRLFETLVKLAHPEVFLRGSQSGTSWSKLRRDQQLAIVKTYNSGLSRDEQVDLKRITSGCSKTCKELLRIINEGQ